MLSWSYINRSQDSGEDVEDEEPRETSEAREARHNAAYKEALAFHGAGTPHSEAWASAKQLYDAVISDEVNKGRIPAKRKSAFDTPVRFLCLKNLADMVEREGDDDKALELYVAAAEEDETNLAVWLKMARLARRAGVLNLARLALESLLEIREDHVLALRTLRDVLLEIGDGAAVREVSARLLSLDPYGNSIAAGERHTPASTQSRPNFRGGNAPSTVAPPERQQVPPLHLFVERTLELPSWERIGKLLVGIRASICGKEKTDSDHSMLDKIKGASATTDAAGGVDVNHGGGVSLEGCAVPSLQSPPTLSTPVRIVVRPPDKAVVIDATLDGQDAGAASEADLKGREEQRQQQLRRLPRRASVEKAMEWYSDGCSSDSEDGDQGKSAGRGCGGAGGGGSRGNSRWGERRISVRRQRQDEMREADVAAARENDMQFRVASLFVPVDEVGNGNDTSAPASETEGRPWWPQLAENGGGTGGGSVGSKGETDSGDAEDDGAALASKMLPVWRQRHDVDCRRCGEGGVVLCCDFCHLVYHPRCLEVTPSLTSLFACADCQEEAATVEWELKGRAAAAEAVDGDLWDLLRAADGHGGNGGVIDLMLRWLKGMAKAPAGDLCPEASFFAEAEKARPDSGLLEASKTEAGLANSAVSQLANITLAIESVVRGFLPTRLSWSVIAASSGRSCGANTAGSATADGGPELGVACELSLAEIHVDKAMALLQHRTAGRGTTPVGTSSAVVSSTAVVAAPAAALASASASAGASVSNTGADVGSKKNEVAPAAGGGAGEAAKSVGGDSSQPLDSRRQEAAEHLATADSAMLLLEPWLSSGHEDVNDEESVKAAAQDDGGYRTSIAAPWVLAVRWWWLKGTRTRHAGHTKEALECFRRCERLLRARGRKEAGVQGRWARVEDDDDDEEGVELVVVLPYCVVHPRIDLQVVRGVIADMELSGTSEAAREAFAGAINLLSESPTISDTAPENGAAAGANTVKAVTASGTGTSQPRVSSSVPESRSDVRGDGDNGGSGDKAKEGRATGDAAANGLAVPATSSKGIPADSLPETAFPSSVPPSSEGGGNVGVDITTATDVVRSTPGGEVPVSTGSRKDEALAALATLFRGLESRFVARARPTSALPPLRPNSSTAEVPTGGQGEYPPGVGSAEGSAKCGVEARSNSSLLGVPGGVEGWTVRIRPARAEELLVDLLEREKGHLPQVNGDGARALERWMTANNDASATSSPFFIAPILAVSSAPTIVAAAAGIAQSIPVASGGGKPPGFAGGPLGAREGIALENSASAAENKGIGLKAHGSRHFPLPLTAPGLGENSCVFSMILRGALLLDRHETAVLLALRCAEHFLDASDLLASPKGPLSFDKGGSSPARGNRRGGGHGNEGLGALHLLLTTREPEADRRVVDAAATSACAEFLAHALAVALWAVPHTTRGHLLGSSDVDGKMGDGERVASTRKGSVLRCLARLMKHSVDGANTRVLNMALCAWQAVAAVASSGPGPLLPRAPPPALQVSDQPLRSTEMGELSGGGEAAIEAETGAQAPCENAMEVDTDTCLEDLRREKQGKDSGDGGDDGSRAGCGGAVRDEAVGSREQVPVRDTFADPLRALVRCLCGAVIDRWKQASSVEKTPKKSWVLHGKEAVHALTRTLEYERLTSTCGGKGGEVAVDSGGDAADAARAPRAGVPSTPTNPDGTGGCSSGFDSLFFSSANELKEVVDALIGLSQLPDGLATSATASSSSTPKGGVAGVAGVGGAGGGSGAGGVGIKLACSLALLTIGLSDAASSLDAQRRVGLVETLHDHLKGTVPTAPPNLGAVPDVQGVKSGHCADGEGVFLKTALLYLSSREVAFAVDKEEAEVSLAAGSSSNDYSDSSSDVDTDGDTIDVDGSSIDDRKRKKCGKEQRRRDKSDVSQGEGCGSVSGGGGRRPEQNRSERLGERVIRATAQCQACLYDIAMLPCADHRCLTPPRPPSTALEAYALYICWESRLPTLRRSHTLRLLEAVIGHKTFASPPRTRFSKVIENQLFSAWPVTSDRASGGAEGNEGRRDENVGSGGAMEGSVRELSDSEEADLGLEEVLGLLDATGVDGTVVDDKPPTARSAGSDRVELTALGSGSAASEEGGAQSGVRATDGVSGEGIITTATMSVGLGPERTTREAGEDGTGKKIRRNRGQVTPHGTGKGEKSYTLSPEMKQYSRVYLGLYWNLAEAKGVPSGPKLRTPKSADEGADMEALLMQGIRWRLLDLWVCPDRMSSWKGLAQCACRLAAVYLDAFSPSCHRLGVPLTTITTASTLAEKAVTEQEPPLGSDRATAVAEIAAGTEGPSAADVSTVVVDDGSSSVSITVATGGSVEGGGDGACGGVHQPPQLPAVQTVAMEVDATHSPEDLKQPSANIAEEPQSDHLASLTTDVNRETSSSDTISPAIGGGFQVTSASEGSKAAERTGGAGQTSDDDLCAKERELSRKDTAKSPTSHVINDAPAPNSAVDTQASAAPPPPSAANPLSLVVVTAPDLLSSPGSKNDVIGEGGQGCTRETVAPQHDHGSAQNEKSQGGHGGYGASEIPAYGVSVLGLRAIPGPDFCPFFRGSALDAKAARKIVSGAGGSGTRLALEGGSRLAAIADGLRHSARTAAEASACEAMATRILDGTATQEEWVTCLGHASVAAAVGVAKRSFAAWKALAEDALTRKRVALRASGEGKEGAGGGEGGRVDCEAAARELAECCEEEAFMTYMLARDVFVGCEEENPTATAPAAANHPVSAASRSTLTPAGLEIGGQRQLLEASLALLRRAGHLKETGGSPSSASPRLSRRRRRSALSPLPKELLEAFTVGGESDNEHGGDGQDECRETRERDQKRRKIDLSESTTSGPGSVEMAPGSGAGQAEGSTAGGSESRVDDDDDDDEDELRWQAPFVIGRLCARLGKHPRMVLESLSQAVQLAKAEHVPLEDELEALCRLHATRAKLVLSGDLDSYSANASMLDEFSFCDDDSTSRDAADGNSVDGASVSSASQPPGVGANSRQELDSSSNTGVAIDPRRRRLAAVNNCLDAFDSCLKKRRGQHTAIFAMSNALFRGAGIVQDAYWSSLAAGIPWPKGNRSFGPQAALLALKPLFEKRQQLLAAMSVSDGAMGPGLALLGSRRRKLHSLRRKYVRFYVELLQVTKNTATLQGLLRRTRAPRETREEMLWVQATALRALLAILRSEVLGFPKAPVELRSPPPVTAAAAAVPATATTVSRSLAPLQTPATQTPATPADVSTPSVGVAVATGVAGAGASAMHSETPADAPSGVATNASSVPISSGGVGDQSIALAAAATSKGSALAPTQTPTAKPQSLPIGGAPNAPQQSASGRPQTEAPSPPQERVAAAGVVVAAGTAAAVGGASAGEGVGELQKKALERSWDLYLQVLDLETSARSGSVGGSGPGPNPLPSSSSATLLRDAEEVLVKSWQAFGEANPALLELVELQNTTSSSGGGSGVAAGEGGGKTLRRARACCHALWPDKQGKGKVSKSKLKLKRPAPASVPSTSSNRAAPRPKVMRPAAPIVEKSVQPATASTTVASVTETTAPAVPTTAGSSVGAGSTTIAAAVEVSSAPPAAATATATSPAREGGSTAASDGGRGDGTVPSTAAVAVFPATTAVSEVGHAVDGQAPV